MILFQKKVLIYLKRQGLEIYSAGQAKLTFDFTLETVVAEEVNDKEKLRSLLVDFLKNNNLSKSSVVIILAEDLVFQKNLAEKEEFVEKLPFSKEKIISRDYPAKNLILAVNGELFNLLIDVVTSGGGKVLFVSPITLLGVSTIDENNYRQVMNNKRLQIESDLLNTRGTGKNIVLKLTLVLIVVVLLTGGGLFYYFRPVKKVSSEILKEPSQQVTPTKEATISAIISPKSKKGLVIKVLNGTGKAGDAKKVKDALEGLNYQNIEIDNLDVQNTTNSAVVYSSSAQFYLPEITTLLEKIFKLKPLTISTDSTSFDLQITTGN